MPVLVDAADDNTTGDWFKVAGPWSIYARGVWDGATATIQVAMELDGEAISAHEFTENGIINDTVIGPHWVRALITDADTNTEITISHAPLTLP